MTEGISFNPPALPLIARKRPVIEQPAIPSREDSHQNISQTPIDGTRTSPQSVQHRPLYAVPFDPKNMATTSQASHIPNSTELFNYDELRQVNSLLDGFRFRYLDLATRYAAIQQDFSAAQSKLVDAEYGWQSDRAALQRANQGCQELQVHVESLLNRINQMSGVQQSFKEKGDSIEDLVSSLEKLKSQMSIKISKLEDDLQVERDKYLTMVEKLEALKSDYEKELSDHKQKLDKTAAELVEMTSEKSWGSDELRKAQEEQNRISEELSHAKESLQAVKHQLEGQFTDFKKGTRQLIKRLASDMGCRQPSSFGDSSIVALENVIKELVDEQQAMIRSNLKDLDKTTLDAKENLEKAMQELSEKCQQLSYVESELTIIKTKSAAMELEILEKGSKIDRLEGRVAEQQIEHSAATAKLADHQNMRMLVNLLNEVFENEASKMEYEDLRSVLMVEIF
jgi:chromosome segregation ATPase